MARELENILIDLIQEHTGADFEMINLDLLLEKVQEINELFKNV